MYKMATVGGGGGGGFLGIFVRLYRVPDRLSQVDSKVVCCPTAVWMEWNGLTRQFVTVTSADPPSGWSALPLRAIRCCVSAYFIAQRAVFTHCTVTCLALSFERLVKTALWPVYRLLQDGFEPVDVPTARQLSIVALSIAHSTQFFPASEQKGRPVCLCTGLFFFLSFPPLPPANMCCPTHARARTRKPTEYSKKSCAFQGHGDILQTVD